MESYTTPAASRSPAADIYLDDEKNTARAHAISDEDGSFKLTVDHGGTYTVRAAKIRLDRRSKRSNRTSARRQQTYRARDGKFAESRARILTERPRQLQRVERQRAQLMAPNSTNGIEFSDEPSFTVAGVTDRSNLGLHGSDTTARTSDSLARETARLKGGRTRENRTR